MLSVLICIGCFPGWLGGQTWLDWVRPYETSIFGGLIVYITSFSNNYQATPRKNPGKQIPNSQRRHSKHGVSQRYWVHFPTLVLLFRLVNYSNHNKIQNHYITINLLYSHYTSPSIVSYIIVSPMFTIDPHIAGTRQALFDINGQILEMSLENQAGHWRTQGLI